ncbi:MAG: FHA domain-containing protein [Stigonema ocellatum SAG 48.90 = DSM 106950]|nr:FHA domain-containing protein [Stigonema ocellatum SAG 48.90 = DSM 106950]
MIRIKVIDPQKQDQQQEVELKPETKLNQECLIGRFSNCDLVLDSAEVSRMHGKFSQKNGSYYFTDLASSCGSRINGEKAQINQDYPLKPEDMIQIGRFFLRILVIGLEEENTILELQNITEEISHRRIPETPAVSHVSPEDYMPVAMVEPSKIQRWVKGELTVRCVGVIDETHDVKTFRFVADPPLLFTYKPGQFVTLELEIMGVEVSRCYSISSSPSRPHTLEITVKRVPLHPGCESDVPQGLVSNWLHENVTVGSSIKLHGPSGKFTCFTNPNQKLLFISGGSGITPMMSMSRWLCDTGSHCDVTFFHFAPTAHDIIFRQELEMMSAQHRNFHLAVSITRKEPGQSWLSLTGRLNAAMLEVVAPDFRDRTVYVCAPEAFMDCISQILKTLDFPMENYYSERFAPPPHPSKSPATSKAEPLTSPVQKGLKQIFMNLSPENVSQSNIGRVPSTSVSFATNTPTLLKSTSSSKISVVFSKSNIEVMCDGEESILTLAKEAGLKIRSSCRSGVCGTCKKRKLQGEVRVAVEPLGLEESELQEDYILTCISYPIGQVVIDA